LVHLFQICNLPIHLVQQLQLIQILKHIAIRRDWKLYICQRISLRMSNPREELLIRQNKTFFRFIQCDPAVERDQVRPSGIGPIVSACHVSARDLPKIGRQIRLSSEIRTTERTTRCFVTHSRR
jgi:hypothetical protein